MTLRSLVGRFAALILGLGMVLMLIAPTPVGAVDKGQSGQGRIVPEKRTGRVFVKFRPGTAGAQATKALDGASGRAVDSVGAIGVRVVQPVGGAGVDILVSRLKRNPNVAYAEPERVMSLFAIPNDPYYGTQWGHGRIQSSSGWNISKGASAVKIGVVDTGIDRNHPDLMGRYVEGYDFVRRDSVPNDEHGHGTHVAGIAAATGNNGAGVAGVGWYTKILAAKVLGGDGTGTDLDVSRGIIWSADKGAAVINLSLGNYYYSQAVADAVKYAQGKGALIVAAAGNDGLDFPSYPAALPGVVGVAATDRYDSRAWFSNYGSYVDISAPGVDIYSTWPGSDYASLSGTSMASPFVAGAAAVVKAKYPAFTAGQVWDRLGFGANDIGIRGKDQYTGYGRLNLFRALAIPGQVSGVVKNAKSGSPLPGVKVSLKGTTRYVVTDSYGRYMFRNIPYGRQTLTYSRWAFQDYTTSIWMPAKGNLLISLSLKPLAKLTGYVRASSGALLSGATVRIANTTRSDVTDSNGYYVITNVPLGTRSATASRDGYASQFRSTTFTMGTTSRLDFSLSRK